MVFAGWAARRGVCRHRGGYEGCTGACGVRATRDGRFGLVPEGDLVPARYGGPRPVGRASDTRLSRIRVAHCRRRQSKLECRRHLSQEGRAAVAQRVAVVAPAARVRSRRSAPRRRRPLLLLRGPQHVLGQYPQPRARYRIRVSSRAVGSGRRARRSEKESSPCAPARSRNRPLAGRSTTSIRSITAEPSSSRRSRA